MRRCRSPSWPVINACKGALNPSAAADCGMSCASPSVIMIAPPTRSGGASASAAAQGGEKLGSFGFGFIARGFDDPKVDVSERLEPRFEFVARLVGLLRPFANALALRPVDNHRDDVLERAPVLLDKIGIAQGEQQERQA